MAKHNVLCPSICSGSGNPALQAPVIYKYVAAAPGVMHQHVDWKLFSPGEKASKLCKLHVFCMHLFCDSLFLTFIFISVFLLPFSGHLTFIFVERTSFFFFVFVLKKVFLFLFSGPSVRIRRRF